MKDKGIDISLLDESTLEQQVNVYRSAFDPCSSLKENLITWHKKHYENPLGDSIIVGAFIEGQLVGINAYMPVEYTVNGECVKMLQSCESGVIPTCQGKGIWKKIVCYALNYINNETNYKLVIGFPNYINSYPGFEKMGWKTVTNMKNYVIVNNLFALKLLFKDRGVLFRILFNVIRLQRIIIPIYSIAKNITIEDIPLEELIWNGRETGVIQCDHSLQLLRWKKDYKELNAIGIKYKGVLSSTCLYSLSTYKGKPIIKIEKYECHPMFKRKEKNFLATFLKYFARRYPEASFIRAWLQDGNKQEVLFRSLLFFASSHPNPFITSDPKSEYSDMSWDLSFFDLD